MKYCTNCGNELLNDAAFCSACGTKQELTEQKPQKDKMNIFYFIISFIWWWAGLIMFLVFRNSNPPKAKICLSGSLIALGISVALLLVGLVVNIIGGSFAF